MCESAKKLALKQLHAKCLLHCETECAVFIFEGRCRNHWLDLGFPADSTMVTLFSLRITRPRGVVFLPVCKRVASLANPDLPAKIIKLHLNPRSAVGGQQANQTRGNFRIYKMSFARSGGIRRPNDDVIWWPHCSRQYRY